MSEDHSYFYLKRPDGSWDVHKHEDFSEPPVKQYHITPSGKCDCPGYEYNGHCKHVESIVNRFTGEAVDRELARETRDEILDQLSGQWGYEFHDWILDDDLDIVGVEFDAYKVPDSVDYDMMWGRHENGVDIKLNIKRTVPT